MRASARLVGALVVAITAGCAASSSGGGGNPASSPRPGVQPTALTGLGATKTAWVAAHGGLNVGPFSAVTTGTAAGKPIASIHLRFDPVREGIAKFNAQSQLPPDAKVVGSGQSGTCLTVQYASRQLARQSPSVGPRVFAYFFSGPHGSPYNPERVNSVIIGTPPSQNQAPC